LRGTGRGGPLDTGALSKDKWNQRDHEFALAYAEAAEIKQAALPEQYRELEARVQSNLAIMLRKRAEDRRGDPDWLVHYRAQSAAYAERSYGADRPALDPGNLPESGYGLDFRSK
jgi:hypothetical protein